MFLADYFTNDLLICLRWNYAAWAEQGYVVILPNITGSLGYGCEFRECKPPNTTNNILSNSQCL